MDITQDGWPIYYCEYLFLKDTIEEQAAQLKTLRGLGVAIDQLRQILAEWQDRNPLTETPPPPPYSCRRMLGVGLRSPYSYFNKHTDRE